VRRRRRWPCSEYAETRARGWGRLDPAQRRGGGRRWFLACCFWLVDALTLLGRRDDARELFERLLSLRNDVGLLAEGYDTPRSRFAGNFPQALSHLALVSTALRLDG
jgi:GH15 family glucan-1,4-alpha-glucosidase